MEVGCGMTENSMAGCGIKMQWQHRDKPHFEDGMRDRTATCEMINESHSFKIHEATRLLLLK